MADLIFLDEEAQDAPASLTQAIAAQRIQEFLPDISAAHVRRWFQEKSAGGTVAARAAEAFIGTCLEHGYPRAQPGEAVALPRASAREPRRQKSAHEEAQLMVQNFSREVARSWALELRGEPRAQAPLPVGKDGKLSESYRLHALHALFERFPKLHRTKVKHHFFALGTYSAAATELQGCADVIHHERRMQQQPPPCKAPPELVEEIFAHMVGPRLEKRLQRRRKNRRIRILRTRRVGGFNTCACCFREDLLEEETLFCSAREPHSFCIACVKSLALEFFGSGLFAQNFCEVARNGLPDASSSSPLPTEVTRGSLAGASSSSSLPTQVTRGGRARASSSSSLPAPRSVADVSLAQVRCPDISGCSSCLSDAVLQRALPTREYQRYTRRSAALHAIASGIRDLTPCPACDFMVEMNDQNDGIIRCLNPECERVSCRWCGEEDHRPQRCHEVEKQGEAKLRIFLEEHMTEASARRCPNPKCRKPFEKIEGCNKIKCPCGTSSCYLCGEVLDNARPYNHFKDGAVGGGVNAKGSRCTVYGEPDWAVRSLETALSRTEQAMKEYVEAHPEMRSLEFEKVQQLRRKIGLEEEERAAPTQEQIIPARQARRLRKRAHGTSNAGARRRWRSIRRRHS